MDKTQNELRENYLWRRLETIVKAQRRDSEDDIKPSLMIEELVKYSNEKVVIEGISDMLDDIVKEED
jgi:hypothetical protein